MWTFLAILFFLLSLGIIPLLFLIGLISPAFLTKIFRQKRIFHSRKQVVKEGILSGIAGMVLMAISASKIPPTPTTLMSTVQSESTPTSAPAGVVEGATDEAETASASSTPEPTPAQALTPTLQPTSTPKPTAKIFPTATPKPYIAPTSKPVKIAPTSPPVINDAGYWPCNCAKTCAQMSSCAEAQYQLNQCGCSRRDGDGDGIACDSDCQ